MRGQKYLQSGFAEPPNNQSKVSKSMPLGQGKDIEGGGGEGKGRERVLLRALNYNQLESEHGGSSTFFVRQALASSRGAFCTGGTCKFRMCASPPRNAMASNRSPFDICAKNAKERKEGKGREGSSKN